MDTSRIAFRIPFCVFQTIFCIDFIFFSGAVSFCRCAALKGRAPAVLLDSAPRSTPRGLATILASAQTYKKRLLKSQGQGIHRGTSNNIPSPYPWFPWHLRVHAGGPHSVKARVRGSVGGPGSCKAREEQRCNKKPQRKSCGDLVLIHFGSLRKSENSQKNFTNEGGNGFSSPIHEDFGPFSQLANVETNALFQH